MKHVKRILVIFGTRPEAIKMIPVVKELQRNPERFATFVGVTGQHREMLDQVLNIFDVRPDFDLNVMSGNQDLYDVTSKILLGMRDALAHLQPDMVLVHGDTTTSMAAALSAFYAHIPVGHVEAGLRTYNLYSPWPEEMNRQLTGRIAFINFAPTPLSRANLLSEGVSDDRIVVTGNTVIDALYEVLNRLENEPCLLEKVRCEVREAGYDLHRLCDGKKMVLITGHRRENFGEGFTNICRAISRLAETFPEVEFIYPMHLNPNVRNAIKGVFGDSKKSFPNLHFIEPLHYLSFVYMMSRSYIVLTDSGGIQEEAPGLGKPVLVMRDTTERPEAVDAGTVKLVGTDEDKIFNSVTELLTDEHLYKKMSQAVNPYGDGRASQRIVEALLKHYQN